MYGCPGVSCPLLTFAHVCLSCHLCLLFEDILQSSRRHCAWGGTPAVHEEWRGPTWAYGAWHPWWVLSASGCAAFHTSVQEAHTCGFSICILGCCTVPFWQMCYLRMSVVLELTRGYNEGESSELRSKLKYIWRKMEDLIGSITLSLVTIPFVSILPLF